MKKEMGHKFLKKLGKTRLRPGGIKGTSFLLAHADIKEGQVILEVACNKGLNLLNLAKNNPGAKFIGIDIDKDVIKEANDELEKTDLKNVKFVCANAFRMEFADESFDYIIN